jgi:hypothetical protein
VKYPDSAAAFGYRLVKTDAAPDHQSAYTDMNSTIHNSASCSTSSTVNSRTSTMNSSAASSDHTQYVRQPRTQYTIQFPYVYYRFCTKCNTVKPPRCHHDSVTNSCVFEMDHFCPWVFNTVGLYNYRYFICFLVFLLLGTLLALYLSFDRFLQLQSDDRCIYQSLLHYVEYLVLPVLTHICDYTLF